MKRWDGVLTTYVYIAQSLDGFIAGKNGELDWLNEIPNPTGSDFGFSEFIDKIDAIIMGRNTFEKVRTFEFWPYNKPVYVISRSLQNLPQDFSDKAELLQMNPGQILQKFKSKSAGNLYIDGGLLIQSFLAEDLIDNIIITVIPVLLGDGIPLFGKQDASLKFRLHSSEVLIDSLVKNHYTRER